MILNEQFKLGERFYDNDQNELELIFNDNKKVVLTCDADLAKSIIIMTPQFFELVANETIYPIYLHNDYVESLSRKQQEKLAIRKPYIDTLERMVNEDGAKPTTKSTYEKLILIVEKEYGIFKHPSKSYIAEWWKLYVNSNFILEETIPTDTHMPTRLTEATEAHISKFIQKVWLNSQSNNQSAGYALYEKDAKELAKTNPAITKASFKAFKKRLNTLTDIELAIASGSRAQIAKCYRTLCKKIITTAALERVEMDGVSFNLALIDEELNEVSGNVSLYIAIDCHTRYPISVTIELGKKESTESVAHLTKNMFINMSDKLMASGKPSVVVADNGPGFKAQKIKLLAQRLRYDYINTPSNMPWKKPFVESFNNTFRFEFCEGLVYIDQNGNSRIGLPGYFSKRTSKKSRRATDNTIQKAAAITIEKFREILLGYLEHYVNQPHRGLNGMTPQQAWDIACAEEPPLQFNYEKNTHIFHINEVKRIIEERGVINLLGQKFTSTANSKALLKLYNLIKSSNPHVHPEVTVKYDLEDARSITVIALINDEKSNPTKHVIQVPNRDLADLEHPVSYAQLSANKTIVPRRALYEVDLDTIKQITKSQTSGKKVPMAEQNISKYPSAVQRIDASNNGLYKNNEKLQDLTTNMGNTSNTKTYVPHELDDCWDGE